MSGKRRFRPLLPGTSTARIACPSNHRLNVPVSRLVLWFGVVALAGQAWANEFDCIIEARQMVDIRSPVEGLIEKIAVERGEGVKKGQVLVTLESGPERAALAVAKQRAGGVGLEGRPREPAAGGARGPARDGGAQHAHHP